jgi:hypothetical protein
MGAGFLAGCRRTTSQIGRHGAFVRLEHPPPTGWRFESDRREVPSDPRCRVRRGTCDKLPYACHARGGSESAEGCAAAVRLVACGGTRESALRFAVARTHYCSGAAANADPLAPLNSAGISGSNERRMALSCPRDSGGRLECSAIARHDSASDLSRYPGTGSSVTRRHKRTRPPNRGGPPSLRKF